MNKQTLQ